MSEKIPMIRCDKVSLSIVLFSVSIYLIKYEEKKMLRLTNGRLDSTIIRSSYSIAVKSRKLLKNYKKVRENPSIYLKHL